ncbi:MAG: phenylacetic acid degradation protein PaaN [Bacteroidota bacterium]
MQNQSSTFYQTHSPVLEAAVKAVHERSFYSAYPENPSPKTYGETADADGKAAFEAMLGKPFAELKQYKPEYWAGEEVSPYTQEALGITYPVFDTDFLLERAKADASAWASLSPEQRAGILIETLERIKGRFFEIAYATMHTTGQGYMMAFQASGPHAADRALEAIALGYEELKRFPESVLWDKPMGKFNIRLDKKWKAVPRGVSLVIGCSTFPTWNTVPGLYASLITGNTVIVKPHPKAIIPIAIVVAEIQSVLKECGLDAGICQLAADTQEHPLTLELAESPAVSLIDYTGGTAFGNRLEAISGKTVFTEKAGVNSVILDSVKDLDPVLANLAFSVCLYSGQMCTAPQNFFIPAKGIETSEGKVSFDEVAERFCKQVLALTENPKAGPFVLGAIQNPATKDRVGNSGSLAKVLLASGNITNPQYPNARTATPLVLETASENLALFSSELFGPIALLIKTHNTDQSIELAADLAGKHGAISCGAYTTDERIMDSVEEAMGAVGTPVSFNLTGGIYVNQNAGFSDFHVTGGNPAGNASFTNPEFIVKRFTWVGFRRPAAEPVSA